MSLEFTELLAMGAIGFLTGSLVVFFAFWKLKKDQLIEGIIENLIEDIGNDQELQKTLYTIGGIVGQGAKAGMGFNVPKNSKFNLNNFLLEMAGNWLSKSVNLPQGAIPSPSPETSPSPQNQSRNDKKW